MAACWRRAATSSDEASDDKQEQLPLVSADGGKLARAALLNPLAINWLTQRFADPRIEQEICAKHTQPAYTMNLYVIGFVLVQHALISIYRPARALALSTHTRHTLRGTYEIFSRLHGSGRSWGHIHARVQPLPVGAMADPPQGSLAQRLRTFAVVLAGGRPPRHHAATYLILPGPPSVTHD
eukprot:6670476-Prymnesium_polylepis.2